MAEEFKLSVTKTGTTILGVVCKDGIVLGADRRATAGGGIVMQKNIKKAIQVNNYLIVAIAGNAADAKLLVRVLGAELKLKELKTKSRPTVKESANLAAMMTYRNIRAPSMIPSIVGTLIAGFNEDGSAELYTVEPAGGIDKVEDYDANFGSGMPFVLGLLERQYKKDMPIKEGIELVHESLKASTQRDTASGNGIDIYSITKSGIEHEISQEILPQYK
jgi:proteasome beta subunit